MQYEHVQSAPMYLILAAVAAGMATAGFTIDQTTVQLALFCAAGVMAGLALSFRHLMVRDEGDSLLISFGPLPLFRRRVDYDNIASVEPTRSTVLDGWGIHLSPSGGWVWNLWGFDAVDIRFKSGGKLRLGTDDVKALTEFLATRTSLQESPAAESPAEGRAPA